MSLPLQIKDDHRLRVQGAPAPFTLAAGPFRNSGRPDEDVAEATALYFLTVGTQGFEGYRAVMPGRFALVRGRFGE
jgi:hypothetical protein